MRFEQVQDLLKKAIAGFETKNGRQAQLGGHGASFSWETKDKLKKAFGHGKQLIQPELIGVDGEQTNLVIDLRRGISSPVLRMPKGGPFLSDDEITVISKWIKDGCPD
jgi:hypothetical protein